MTAGNCTAARHGTALAYQSDGCRCESAKVAQSRYKKQLRWRHHNSMPIRIDATGTQRRIRALMTLGWTRGDILRHAGYQDSSRWLVARRVHVTTARRIAAVYDRLAGTAGPSQWTATYARNRGWAPPEAWTDATIDDPAAVPWSWDRPPAEDSVDPVVVERALAGWPVSLNPGERADVVRQLTARGLSARQIAARVGCSARQVTRDRAATTNRREAS